MRADDEHLGAKERRHRAISSTDGYDDGIRDNAKAGKSGEALFVELALEDLRRLPRPGGALGAGDPVLRLSAGGA